MERLRPWLAAGGVIASLSASVNGQNSGFWLVGLPEGAHGSSVRALSKNGLVGAGGSYILSPEQSGSFRWTAAGGRDDWGYAPGMPPDNFVFASNETGQIVAGAMLTGTIATSRAFRRVGDGPVENLGLLPGEERCYARGISGNGMIVVGTCEHGNNGQFTRAFRWTPTDGMHPLSNSLPNSQRSFAHAISRDGTTVVGYNINDRQWPQPFVWTEAGGMQILPTLTGQPWDPAFAQAVNADGTVIVGMSLLLSGKSHATRWVNGEVEDLAATFGWMYSSHALAVNDDGGVVGGVYGFGPSNDAFVWTDATGMLNAKEFFSLQGVEVPSNYHLQYLYAISGDGLTFGGIAQRTDGKYEGWIARLPGTSGGCVPDCDESGELNIDDFICFQTYFAIGDATADCDASGQLNIDDFICFQTFFSLGC